ncbi:lipocalin family protein [Alkalimarinus sediminis]|uniref:Outer membrane lipoprotein Blc n=1 Tax=Alkalimarinus sediminis TaxID=1632866 RepID=A0A9E8HK71_9ALTE|nr:lipocalin family protein [Alkalimarinus sediminis]UZW74281.1 lipocalin family protein [Alkalimarinus sediminis]
MRYILAGLILLLSGCVGVPEGITPITNFNIDRYAGTWYEIARLDHSFERDMEQVSAEYSMREDGGVKVINRGFDTKAQEWKEAEGKAYFVEDQDTGHLKVSFFGPFYGSYIVFELGEDEQYAFVTSSDKSYLWFLSRTKEVDDELKQHFIETVRNLGFDSHSIIFVDQKNMNQTAR